MGINSCIFDDDKGIVTLEYENGSKLVVLVEALEKSLKLTPIQNSKLVWLLYNETSTFMELHLSGKLESYLAWYEDAVQEQESNLRASLEKHYDPETARQIAWEFMMYDS